MPFVVFLAGPLCSGDQRRNKGGRHGCKGRKHTKEGAPAVKLTLSGCGWTQDTCVLALLQRMRRATLLQRYFLLYLLTRIFDKKHTGFRTFFRNSRSQLPPNNPW